MVHPLRRTQRALPQHGCECDCLDNIAAGTRKNAAEAGQRSLGRVGFNLAMPCSILVQFCPILPQPRDPVQVGTGVTHGPPTRLSCKAPPHGSECVSVPPPGLSPAAKLNTKETVLLLTTRASALAPSAVPLSGTPSAHAACAQCEPTPRAPTVRSRRRSGGAGCRTAPEPCGLWAAARGLTELLQSGLESPRGRARRRWPVGGAGLAGAGQLAGPGSPALASWRGRARRHWPVGGAGLAGAGQLAGPGSPALA
eukprot:gene12439-biopygen416